MKTFLAIIYLILLVYFGHKLLAVYGTKEDDNVEFLSVAEQIEKLNRIKEQIQTIEELITDITVCSPDVHEKTITLEWVNITGKTNKYDLWIDGENATTQELLKTAYAERKRLRTSLQKEIKILQDRCNGNCNGNYQYFSSNDRGGHELWKI